VSTVNVGGLFFVVVNELSSACNRALCIDIPAPLGRLACLKTLLRK
jgi:hypothetical protein